MYKKLNIKLWDVKNFFISGETPSSGHSLWGQEAMSGTRNRVLVQAITRFKIIIFKCIPLVHQLVKPLRHNLKMYFMLCWQYRRTGIVLHLSSRKAHSLALNIQNYWFICSIMNWFDILNIINVLTKIMQKLTMNTRTKIWIKLNKLINRLTEYRSAEHFKLC